MAVSISNVYIETFENNVRHLAQQSITRLRPYVSEKSTNGEKHNWETLDFAGQASSGAATIKATTGRIATPFEDLPWARRVSSAVTYHIGETSEQEDPVQMLVDPNSNIASSLGAAMRRTVDDVIIAACTGASLDGAGATPALPAGQTVGDGTAAISFDMVTEVLETFMSADIENDVPKIFVVGPTQVRKLMQLTENTSKDYVRRGLDQLSTTGMVPNWMGFTWIMSTRLLAPAGGELSCLAFTKRAIGLQINKDITVRVAEDPSISFAWRIYCHMTLGAIRVEDAHIVEAHVLDSL
jgi:hypothetical protein